MRTDDLHFNQSLTFGISRSRCRHMEKKDFLIRLESILGAQKEEYLFACVEDLIANGLQQRKFADNELQPCRQDIVEFLARWSRYAGMTQEQCLDWLLPFTMDVLSPLSRSSPSSIRHGTKSMTRYIYASEKEFRCGREGNRFHARCTSACGIHDQMETGVVPQIVVQISPPIMYERLPVKPKKPGLKDANREQFEQALQFIQAERSQNTPRKKILKLLQEGGLQTITGKPWTLRSLDNEIAKMNASTEGKPIQNQKSSS